MPTALDHLNEGAAVTARLVYHRGDRESDFKFGEWIIWVVDHVQRDRKGAIACLGFAQLPAEFDPRSQIEREQPYICLMNGPYELQIKRD